MKVYNINDYIKVKLTDKGKEIVQKDFVDIQLHHPDLILEPIYVEGLDGFYKFQLWDFMRLFGNYFWCGAPPYIENNEIIFCGEGKQC